MNNPVGIYREILFRLPAVSLLRLRAVCKVWCSVIDDPFFIKSHTNHQLSSNNTTFLFRNSTGPPFCPLYCIDLQDLNFTNGLQTIPVTPLRFTRRGLSCLKAFPVAACNGLILIAPVSTKEYVVFGREIRNRDNEMNWDPKGSWEIMNPLTHERLKLPQPNIKSKKLVGIGIGYDCAADDYKIVVIDYEYDDVIDKYSKSQTHIYSLRLDSWRMIGSCPFDGFGYEYGVFFSGALHWVSDDRIIVFDVGSESYHQLALPSFGRKPLKLILSMHIDVLSGCLFLSFKFYEADNSWLDLWVMNDYGGNYTWTKLIMLDGIRIGKRPIAWMNNKRWVLLQNYENEFSWFDVESKTLKRFNIHGISGDFYAQVCVGSLFRLHDSCGRCVAAADCSSF